jgi:PBSX family phage terminase large subunit
VRLNVLPWQYEALHDPTPILLFHGGLGSGKSLELMLDLYQTVRRFPGCQLALSCNDYTQLQNSTHKTLIKALGLVGAVYGRDWTYHVNNKIVTFSNGATVTELTLAKDPQALMGPEWDGIYFDETHRTGEEHWDYLTDRARGKGAYGRKHIRAACNPVPKYHYLAQRFFVTPRPEHRAYRCTTYDNTVNLPPDYIPGLEAKYPPGSIMHRRMMLAETVSLEGTIYSTFADDPDKFLIDHSEVPASANRFLYGLDHGYNDPLVLLEGRVDDDGMLYVTREYYQNLKTINEHVPSLRLNYVRGPIHADHEPERNAALREFGFWVIDAEKQVDLGIETVTSLFLNNRIRIVVKNCPHLVYELCNYAWKQGGNIKHEEPEHKFSHSPDALRYMAMGLCRPAAQLVG